MTTHELKAHWVDVKDSIRDLGQFNEFRLAFGLAVFMPFFILAAIIDIFHNNKENNNG